MNIGIVGIGFMGATHFRAVKQVEGARVSAICTRSQKKLAGDWSDIRGNFGPGGGTEDLTGIKKYQEIDEIIADPEVELLDICLPTPYHRDVAIRALQAGKHVLVEKPIALTLADADAMVQAARDAGRQLMVAQVLRFFPEFAYVKQVVEGGAYGALLGAHFKRIISKPDWAADDWFSSVEKTGGPAIDLHIHDADFVRFLAGMPNAVQSSGVLTPDGGVTYLVTEYLYEGRNMAITCASGAIAMRSVMFEHGYDVYLERATLRHNSLDEVPVTLYTPDGKTRPEIPQVDGFVGEIGYAVRCLKEGREPELLSGQSARDSLYLALKEVEAVKRGGRVAV
ncbi:MAG: Gfo/Idh/MocA family oxidoreductase [Armatimonadota bacterium]|nr:Gfo/Idh/MocA family oxidoreductase [Armatimonadota bacterium]